MRRVVVALLVFVALALSGAGTHAQSGIDVRSNSARSDLPNGVVFTLEAASDTAIGDVRLSYQVAPDGVLTSAVPDCTGTTLMDCRFVLAASRRNLLIPGAEVTYSWTISSGGATQETASQVVTYEDSRFTWRTVNDGNVTVWWYRGSEEEARAVLGAARESLDRIGALVQTTVDFPVKVRYYGSAQDMQSAIVADNSAGVVTLGEVVYSDTAMVSADAAPEDITRHEVAHIVIRRAVKGPFGVPDWLNEGTAVFAQSQLLADQRQAVEQAVRTGKIISVRSLSSASSGALADRVSLFYGESYSLVKYLVDTNGDAKFAALFRAFRQGATDDAALMQVYGFDQDGLENAWRASVGLPARQPVETGTSAPTEAAAGSQQTAKGGGGGAPVGLIVAIAIVTVGLAGGLAGTAVLLARRYR